MKIDTEYRYFLGRHFLGRRFLAGKLLAGTSWLGAFWLSCFCRTLTGQKWPPQNHPYIAAFSRALTPAIPPGVAASLSGPFFGPFFQAHFSALRAKPIFAPVVFAEFPFSQRTHFQLSQNKPFSRGPFSSHNNSRPFI